MVKKEGNRFGIFLIVCFLIIGFLIANLINTLGLFKKNYTPKEIPNSEQEILNNCQDLILEEEVKCWRDNVKTFYKFTPTEDSITLSFKELKEKGGDCRNWAFFYKELGEKSGFNTDTILIELNKFNHRIALINNGKDYCMIDQTSYWCMVLKDD